MQWMRFVVKLKYEMSDSPKLNGQTDKNVYADLYMQTYELRIIENFVNMSNFACEY